MEERRSKNRLLAIAAIGILGCAGAVGFRMVFHKPLEGLWRGYSYQKIDGKMMPDTEFGEYIINLNKNGSYEENGNSTSGKWSKSGGTVTLTPVKFYDMTPEQHRQKYRKRDGKVSVTIERLLASRMKPMTVSYNAFSDTLIFREHNMHYEYNRSR